MPAENCDDEWCLVDIRDREALARACAGVSAVIHLAAIPDEAEFHDQLLPMNLEGAFNAFEAARRSGVPRIIFISTGQTVLMYPKGEWVSPEMPPRPSSVYACTKLFGEALARYFADVHGLRAIVIRLCWFQPYDSPLLRRGDPMLREWCSPRDLAQLLEKCLRTDLAFGVFFGVSNNTGRFWDVSNAQRLLGYEPQDNAEDYASAGDGVN